MKDQVLSEKTDKNKNMATSDTLAFVDPAAVVSQLDLEPGSTVADFGCGSGFFSFEFSKKIGSEGIVHALDVLPAALEAVTSQAKNLMLPNVVTKRVNLENENGSGLVAESVDWVVLKDILFQNQRKDIILREVARVLRPGGHALIMEWNPNETMVGPAKELRVSPEQLKTLLKDASLSVEREINVGGFHFGFVIKK